MSSVRLPYSTIGGQVTRGEQFAQLLDYLRLCADCCQRMAARHDITDYAALIHNLTCAEEAANVLGHLHATEDTDADRLLSHGWHGVAEMLHNNRITLNFLATQPHINRYGKVKQVLEKIVFNVRKMHEAKLH